MAVQYIWNRDRTVCYVYAYKGGPKIMTHKGTRRPQLTAEASRKLAEALEKRNAPADHVLRTPLLAWQKSPEWDELAAGTKKVWRSHIDLIEKRWGDKPTSVWNDPRMTAKVVIWRDERRANPRSADIGVTVLRSFLKWAKLRGHVSINAALDIPQLYRGGSREEIVWLDEDIERFAAKAIEEERPHIIDGLKLAAATGLRRADLVSLTFEQVSQFSINKTALKKSRGKRRKVVIPMTPDLEALLAELRTRDRKPGVETVLVNSFGQPWSGDGFGGSFNRIRDLADITHTAEEEKAGKLVQVKRKKHLHDVRGTFCTMLLAECGLTDEEAAPIMGWSKDRVASIRRVYVDDARVVVAIGERIAARSSAKQGAKQ